MLAAQDRNHAVAKTGEIAWQFLVHSDKYLVPAGVFLFVFIVYVLGVACTGGTAEGQGNGRVMPGSNRIHSRVKAIHGLLVAPTAPHGL